MLGKNQIKTVEKEILSDFSLFRLEIDRSLPGIARSCPESPEKIARSCPESPEKIATKRPEKSPRKPSGKTAPNTVRKLPGNSEKFFDCSKKKHVRNLIYLTNIRYIKFD